MFCEKMLEIVRLANQSNKGISSPIFSHLNPNIDIELFEGSFFRTNRWFINHKLIIAIEQSLMSVNLLISNTDRVVVENTSGIPNTSKRQSPKNSVLIIAVGFIFFIIQYQIVVHNNLVEKS